MKFLFSILALVVASAAHAGLPQQPVMTSYSKLWTDSPFTAKPPHIPAAPQVDPFEGYSLGGVSRVEGGYFVIILHDKEPEKKVRLLPGVKSDWEILEVKFSDTFWRETTVRVRHGGKEGDLSFDDAQLTLAAAPQAAPQQNRGGPPRNQPGIQPGQNNPRGPQGNMPRPRQRVVVPPPAPATGR